MKAFDPTLASPFRIEWLADEDTTTQDDIGRAIAEKAESLLLAAQFIRGQQASSATDVEVRVWVEAAGGANCVSITWEPGVQAYGFHLLDQTLKERIAVVVFRDLPCIDADASDAQFGAILQTLALARDEGTVRIPVVEHRTVDPGVER